MKNLSLATVLEKNKLSSDVAFIALIELTVISPVTGAPVATLRFANNNEDITCNGQLFIACGFDFEVKQEAGKQTEVTLSVTDYTQTIQQQMQAYGGGVGSKVVLYIVRSDALTQAPEISEFFQITSASAAEYVSSFQLGAENTLMQTFPRRRQRRDFCQWRFKDGNCKYNGGLTTCDMTLQGANGCNKHINLDGTQNVVNFGGFPGLNSNGNRYY